MNVDGRFPSQFQFPKKKKKINDQIQLKKEKTQMPNLILLFEWPLLLF